VAIVSNRDQVVCPDTEANLVAVGVAADVVLCRANPAISDKNPRFRAVAEGTTGKGLPPLRVVAWVGDNIRDFPALDQNAPLAALEPFGIRYFMLPNPMYGSWETLPRR
jgi:predicted secreted acid phosphatase